MRLAPLLVAAAILLVAFQLVYWDRGRASPWAPPEAGDAFHGVLRYFDARAEAPGQFTEAEAGHLRDVRTLLLATHKVALLFLLAVGWSLWKRPWDEPLLRGGILAVLLAAGLALLAFADFEGFWHRFHVLFFPQGNWQFPPDSTLIALFPQERFESFAAHVLAATASLGAAAAAWGLTLQRGTLPKAADRHPRRKP